MRLVAGFLAGFLWLSCSGASFADPVAQLASGGLVLRPDGKAVDLELVLSRGVPWRVRLRDTPMRVEVDFEEVEFPDALFANHDDSLTVHSVQAGPVRQGLSRLVAELSAPLQVAQAGMRVDSTTGEALLTLRLLPVSRETFASLVARPDPTAPLPESKTNSAPLVVLLDPGHGGKDSGARAGGLREANVMLNFARELKGLLEQTTGFTVHLTRNTDSTLSLEDRINTASQVQADVLISLHADALSGAQTQGAAVYTLSPDARSAADDWLQTRRPGAGTLQSADLTGQGSDVAAALLELSRRQTSPRSGALAHALVQAIGDADLHLYKNPEKHANFVVLRSADVPSVLVELGFLSHSDDRARLQDPAWRGFMARALRDGLLSWSVQDYNHRSMLRH